MASEAKAESLLVESLTDGSADHALYLDVDGTLIDIAATPTSVHVADALPALISGLHKHLGGALALVSGRPVSELDRLFSPVRMPAAGAHGAQIRMQQAGSIETLPRGPKLSSAIRTGMNRIAAGDSRLLLEDKGSSLALHYRGAPELAPRISSEIDAMIAAEPIVNDEQPHLLAGKMIFEVTAAGFNKGTALDQFHASQPFAGRIPIMIGDDTTDEFAFNRAIAHGGMAFGVGRWANGVTAVFESPESVRRALERVMSIALSGMLLI